MKIISSGKALHSPEFYKRKKVVRRFKLIGLAVLCLLTFSAVVYAAHQEKFLITGVAITGDSVVDDSLVAEVARDALRGKYALLFPRANSFIYPHDAIKEMVLRKFSRLESVEITLESLNSMVITIADRKPFALYCRNMNGSECYFADKTGYIFDQAPSFSERIYFIFTTVSPIEEPIGKKPVEEARFVSLADFAGTLATLDVYPTGVRVGAEEYSLILPTGGEIIWKSDDNLSLIYSNLEAFLTSDTIKSEANFLEKVSYLDLRTPNKVFYKFRE